MLKEILRTIYGKARTLRESALHIPIRLALAMVLYLMRAQLFYDGNKRIAMLIGNKIMIENGQGVISVRQKDIKEFYSLLVSYYETGNGAELEGFLYDNCVDGMTFSESDKI